MWGLAGIVEDLVEDVFRAVFVFQDVVAVTEDSALFHALNLGWGVMDQKMKSKKSSGQISCLW